MASRPVYVVSDKNDKFVEAVLVDFKWHSGFAITQKQKSIQELHNSFTNKYGQSMILEISSKSTESLGVNLSAFNLMINHSKSGLRYSVESAFQSSKVFENGGPYIDLLKKTSKEAKQDSRLKNSGELIKFTLYNYDWPLEPKTLFYDWLYINALSKYPKYVEEIVKYDAFTDIEFNPNKSINCQAGAAALFVSLYRRNLIDKALSSIDEYIKIITNKNKVDNENNLIVYEQLSLF